MLGIITKFIGPVMPYLLIGFITTTTVLTFLLHRAGVKYDNMVIESTAKIERAQNNVVQMEKTIGEQTQEIYDLIAKQATAKAERDYRDTQIATLQKSLDDERLKNESYRNRWKDVAFARPTLLARLINSATTKRVRQFALATSRTGNNENGNQNGSD